jgi:hypothetical protein
MVEGIVVATPNGTLPFAVVVRSRGRVVRREPAQSMGEADRLLQRLIADVRGDHAIRGA